MFDSLEQYFGDPIFYFMIGPFLLIGVLVGIFLRPWIGNQVLKFIPDEHRFLDLEIEEETAISIQCKKKKGMPLQRFFKLHPGFTGIVGRIIKKPITRFLAIEGTAYTWQIESGKDKLLGKLVDAVKTVWGDDFWSSVPETKQKELEESRIAVTVGLDKSPLTPRSMRQISEEDIKTEQDRQASETFWFGRKITQRGFYINLILAGGTGFGICAALFLLGILKVPSATVIKEVANQTAGILRSLIG